MRKPEQKQVLSRPKDQNQEDYEASIRRAQQEAAEQPEVLRAGYAAWYPS